MRFIYIHEILHLYLRAALLKDSHICQNATIFRTSTHDKKDFFRLLDLFYFFFNLSHINSFQDPFHKRTLTMPCLRDSFLALLGNYNSLSNGFSAGSGNSNGVGYRRHVICFFRKRTSKSSCCPWEKVLYGDFLKTHQQISATNPIRIQSDTEQISHNHFKTIESKCDSKPKALDCKDGLTNFVKFQHKKKKERQRGREIH